MKQHLNTLYVTRDGVWLSKEGETICVSEKGKTLLRVPLHNLESIVTMGWDISASPQLMSACAEHNIGLSFCSPYGKFFAACVGEANGNVLLRREQYRRADHEEQSLAIARNMIAAKISNARHVLMRAARDHENVKTVLEPVVGTLSQSIRRGRVAESSAILLGIEGFAADSYFSAFQSMIRNDDPFFSFRERTRRPPKNAVNALLSFVYTLLASDCRSGLATCGLDPFVGFFHRDRPGRIGLALDMMEEFRAPLADRLVLSLINRQQLNVRDFDIESSGAVFLKEDSRKRVISAWQERKKEMIVHPFLQEKMTIGFLPHIQARLLARHLRGDLEAYPPMIWK